MVGLQIVPDSGQRSAQFLPVEPVASVAETAQPLVTMSLRDDGASADDLPALAPGVARRTHLSQATLWWRQFLCLRLGSLPSGLPRPIDVKDHACSAFSIDQLAGVSLCVQRTREQIGEKERAQGFCRREGSSWPESARAPSEKAGSRARTRP